MRKILSTLIMGLSVMSASQSFACEEVTGKWNCDGTIINISFETKDGMSGVNIFGDDISGKAHSEHYVLDGQRHTDKNGDSYTASCLPTEVWFLNESAKGRWIQTYSYQVKENAVEVSVILPIKVTKMSCPKIK